MKGQKMKRVKIEGMKTEAPPKVTATLELEEDPEIFDLSSGSRFDHFCTILTIYEKKSLLFYLNEVVSQFGVNRFSGLSRFCALNNGDGAWSHNRYAISI